MIPAIITTSFLASVAPLLSVKGTGIKYAVPEPQNSAHSVDFKTVLTTQLSVTFRTDCRGF